MTFRFVSERNVLRDVNSIGQSLSPSLKSGSTVRSPKYGACSWEAQESGA